MLQLAAQRVCLQRTVAVDSAQKNYPLRTRVLDQPRLWIVAESIVLAHGLQ